MTLGLEKYEDRLCNLCLSGEVQDEIHFVIDCHIYNAERDYFFSHKINDIHCMDLSSSEKLVLLMK